MHMVRFILYDWCVLQLWTSACFVKRVNTGKYNCGLLYLQHFSISIVGFFWSFFFFLVFFFNWQWKTKKDYFGNNDTPFLILHCSISPDWEPQSASSHACQTCQPVCKKRWFFWKQNFWFCTYLKKTVLCYDCINAIYLLCAWCF